MRSGSLRRTLVRVHLAAALGALLLIACFWLATAFSALCLDVAGVVFVKRGILAGIAPLVPALIAAGATGRLLGGANPGGLVARKLGRMKVIAANGLCVLVPCAVTLARLAEAGRFGPLFSAVQALELAAGALNVVLLLKNARDGFRLAGRFREQRKVI